MRRKQILLLTVLVTLVAIPPLVAAALPYARLKPLADSLMADGNFRSLREDNAPVFRILLGSTGLLLLGIAHLIGSGRIPEVKRWFSQFTADSLRFCRAITPSGDGRVSRILLAGIIGVAIVFRLLHVFDEMTHDESFTFVMFASGSLFNAITNYHLPNNHVLNSLLILLSTHVFGNEPWAVRLPALIAGLCVVPACYAVANSIYDEYTALASAAAISILPGAIFYSTTGRGYALVALFTLLTLWLAHYVRHDKNRFAWALLVFFSALGFYAVPVMLFPFGIVFTWLFLENQVSHPAPYASRADFLKHWLIAGVSSATLVLLLYSPIFIYTGADKVFANPWVRPEAYEGYLSMIPGRAAAVWREWTGGIPPVLTALLLLGFLLSLIFHRRIARQRFPLQGAAILWIAALVLLLRPLGVQKLWAFLQAPFMMWTAAGLIGLIKGIRLRFARNVSLAAIALGLVLGVVLATCVRILPTLSERREARGPVQKTVLSLRDRLGTKDLILIDAPYDAATWYHARLYGIPDACFDSRLPFDRLFVIVSRSNGQTLESVLRNRGPDPSLIDREAARLIFSFQDLETYEVPHR